jgi:hypothetical protein
VSVFNRTALKEIVIPDEVKELQSNAFAYCEALTTVTLPKAVKKYLNMLSMDVPL